MRHPFPSKRLRIALGTWVAIEAGRVVGGVGAEGKVASPLAADGAADRDALAAIDAAYSAIATVEVRMHPTRAGSDLARINTAPLNASIEIHPDTWQVLKLAQRLHGLTDGIFDPCLPTRPGRLEDLEIDSKESLVICHAPLRLDLGGIAKGHAVDRAIEKLTHAGCTSGLVNAGGDLRVFGTDRVATILLRRSAGAQTNFQPVNLDNAALAVSDLDAAEPPAEHQGYYTRVGPTTHLRYAAVVAKDAVTADALTKCVLLCPRDVTERVLREFDARSL